MKKRVFKQISGSLLCILFTLSGTTGFANPGSEIGIGVLEQQVLGKKYVGQPEEDRLARLEKVLQGTVSPQQSASYRLSRLFALQKARQDDKHHQLAVQSYNEGIDHTNRGETEQAIEAYRKALQADPGMVEAYNNLANLLLAQQRYEETIEVYKQGLALKPDEALLHRNLGVLYEKLGNVPEAVAQYKTYLKLTHKPDPPIEAIVRDYQAYRSTGNGSPDYMSAATHATHGQPLLWPSRTRPIKVFIREQTAEQLKALPIIRQSLDTWQQATNGRLQFKLVDSSKEANILMLLKDGPILDPNTDIGHTEYAMPEQQLSQHRMDFVTITLNTGTAENRKVLPADSLNAQINRMALHEIGHAIGIWGHSPDPGDIMFTHPIAPQLSSRDINTIRKLYGL
jgi:tetratricopeptide (TPR) repeat protein